MSRKSKVDKTHSSVRPTFTLFRNRCPICLKLHSKSKYFTTLYHLQNHLSTHSSDDESSSQMSIADIKNLIPEIAKAIQLGILLN